MLIDIFGLPVHFVPFRELSPRKIPVTFRRASKAEDRAEKMDILYTRFERKFHPTLSDKEINEKATRLWKRICREQGWEEKDLDLNDEKEK